MPVSVIYIADGDKFKKGDRVRCPVPFFVSEFRKGIVKRVPTLAGDFNKKAVEKPVLIEKGNFSAEKLPKGKNPNSLKNLKKKAK